MTQPEKGSDSTIAIICFITLIAFQVLLAHAPAAIVNVDSYYQLRRKLQHISSGLAIISIYTYLLTPTVSFLTCMFSCAFIFSVHRVRLYSPKLNAFLISAFQGLLRPHEHHSLPGAFYMLSGCGLVMGTCARPIATLAQLYISIGDPIAAFVGQYTHRTTSTSTSTSTSSKHKSTSTSTSTSIWYHRFPNGKSGAGLITMTLVCSIVTAIYFHSATSVNPTIASSLHLIALWSLFGGIIAGVIELHAASTLGIDDNFAVPVLSALILTICQYTNILPHID